MESGSFGILGRYGLVGKSEGYLGVALLRHVMVVSSSTIAVQKFPMLNFYFYSIYIPAVRNKPDRTEHASYILGLWDRHMLLVVTSKYECTSIKTTQKVPFTIPGVQTR